MPSASRLQHFRHNLYTRPVLTTLLAVLFSFMPSPSPSPTPQILEIARDFLKPGHDAEYRAIEIDARNICDRLHFPHHYLAIESLTGDKEVWFLNAFASQKEPTFKDACSPADQIPYLSLPPASEHATCFSV